MDIQPENLEAFSVLGTFLKDDDPPRAIEAASVLLRVSETMTASTVRPVHNPSPQQSDPVRSDPVRSDPVRSDLIHQVRPAARQVLIYAIRRPGPERDRAAALLCDFGQAGKELVPALRDMVLDDLNPAAARALAAVDPDAAMPVLLKALKEGGRAGQEAVVPALAQAGACCS